MPSPSTLTLLVRPPVGDRSVDGSCRTCPGEARLRYLRRQAVRPCGHGGGVADPDLPAAAATHTDGHAVAVPGDGVWLMAPVLPRYLAVLPPT